MNRRRFAAVLTAATMTLALAACGDDDKAGGSEQPYIAIVSKGFQHQFWQAVKKGAEQEAAKEGARITFEGPATEQDIEAQVTMLTNAIAKNPKAIGFAALDSKAAAPEAAKHLSELLGGKGKVAMVVHDQTSKTGQDRRDGFIDWMKANAPGITLLPVQYGGGDQAKSADITKSILAANPDVAGIYGSNEGSAIGVVKGVEEANKKGVKIVGFDSGKAQIDAIKSGLMAGAITQNPIGIGEQTVIAAMKAIKAESQPKIIDTGFYWYDKTNIDEAKIQAVLYQ